MGRFGMVMRLNYYQPEDLKNIVLRSATILRCPIDPEGALEIAKRARGTPRIANRLLRRVRDFAEVKADGKASREVSARGSTSAQIVEKAGERLLARAQEDGIRVLGGLVGERRHVQSAQCDEGASGAVVIRQPVCAPRAGDVDLNHHEIGLVVDIDRRDMFVLENGLVVGRQVRRERGQPERRKERVLDRAPIRARGFGEGRQDELDT
jgi:hypothetical protein